MCVTTQLNCATGKAGRAGRFVVLTSDSREFPPSTWKRSPTTAGQRLTSPASAFRLLPWRYSRADHVDSDSVALASLFFADASFNSSTNLQRQACRKAFGRKMLGTLSRVPYIRTMLHFGAQGKRALSILTPWGPPHRVYTPS